MTKDKELNLLEDTKPEKASESDKNHEVKESTTQDLTLAKKIAQASGDMGAIAKDGKNQKQNFGFISEAAIKAAVRKVTSKYGFAIIPTQIKEITRYERKTQRGGVLYFYDVLQVFKVTDGKESFECEMLGTGSDTGDKAFNKAVTIALKNFEKQLFNISDQTDDPDSETAPETTGTLSQSVTKSVKKNDPISKWSKAKLEAYSITFNHTPTTMGVLMENFKNNNQTAIDFANSLGGNAKIVFETLLKKG